MFCSNCGQPLNENDKFCPECGTPVEQPAAAQAAAAEAVAEQLAEEQPVEEQAVEEQPAEEQPAEVKEIPIEPQPEPIAEPEPVAEPEPEKKSHKALGIVLTCAAIAAVLLTILLLWHPWKKGNSRTTDTTPAPAAQNLTPEPTEAPTPEPTQSPEDVLRAAVAKNQSIQSMHIDFTENVVMSVGIPSANYTQNMEVSLVLGMDAQKEPAVVKAEGTMTVLGQTQNILMYTEEVDDAQWVYASTNGGKTWSRQKQEKDDSSMLSDPANMTELWMENAKDFERIGEETVNGFAATVYSGKLAGKYVENAVSMTGTTIDDDAIKDMDDLPITIWIDNDSGCIVRMYVDMRDMMQKLMEASMKESLAQMGDVEVTVGIDTAEMFCDISQLNAIEEIVIPDEARGRGTAGIPAGEGIIGTWYLCGGEDEESQGYVEMLLSFGMEMSITFCEDGTGALAITYQGESEENGFTYTYEDGKLYIDGTETPCRFEDGRMYLDMDDAQLIFERQ